jgi:ketosteroid isomerase-like protein
MKTNIFVAALLLFIIRCTPQQSDQLNQQQKDQIKSEVKAVMDSMIARDERLDADGVMQYYSPDLIAFSPDGSRSDYQAMKKGLAEMFSSSASFKILATREDIIVMTKDLVIDSWIGKTEAVLKSGDRMVFDPDGVTQVFQRIAGQWKVIYSHESAMITTQKAGKE